MPRYRSTAGLFALAGATLAGACSSTSPSSPSGILSIQGPEALRVGESTQFKVVRLREDRSPEEVLGQWSVTGSFLTVQATNGLAVAGAPGIAELRASVDGQSIVRAVRVVPDMRGTWTGTAVFSCTNGNTTRLIGAGPTPFCKTPSFTSQVTLGGSEQLGETVFGFFAVHDSMPGPFRGRVGVDGSWEWADVSTTYFSDDGHPPHDYIFKGWRMTPPASSGQVSGSGVVEQKFTNAWGYQHFSFTNVSLTLQR